MTISLSFFIHHSVCYAAIKNQNEILSYTLNLNSSETQAASLIPFLKKIWEENAYPPIDHLITACGPGAFTSIRISLATAQGLSLSFPKAKVYAPTSFKVLAYEAQQYILKPFLVLIDSRQGNFYSQYFHPNGSCEEPLMLAKEDILKILTDNPEVYYIIDNETLLNEINENLKFRQIRNNNNLAVSQLHLAARNFDNLTVDHMQFKPNYIHLPHYAKSKQS